MQKGMKNILKASALAMLLGGAYYCGKNHSNNPPAASLPRSVESSKPSSKEVSRMDKTISECFDETTQSKFTALYDQAKSEGTNANDLWITPDESGKCEYVNLAYESRLPIDAGGNLEFIMYIHDQMGTATRLTVKKSDSGWDIINKY